MGRFRHVEEGHPHPPSSVAAVHVLHVTVDLANHHAPPVRGIDPVLSRRCTLVAVKDLLARGGGEVGEVPQVVALSFALAQLAVNGFQDVISDLVADGREIECSDARCTRWPCGSIPPRHSIPAVPARSSLNGRAHQRGDGETAVGWCVAHGNSSAAKEEQALQDSHSCQW